MAVLQWQRNETNIGGGFNDNFNNGDILSGVEPFTLILDSITRRSGVANMTSRLISNISNLISGDRIGCAATHGIMPDTITLDYRLIGINLTVSHSIVITILPAMLPYTLAIVYNSLLYYFLERPPEVSTNISVSRVRNSATVDISLNWDSAFNLLHSVSSYRVVARGGSAASCPSSCDPSGPCMCTGLGIGVDTDIMITAINCGDQMGIPVEVTARPQGNRTQFKVNM